MRQQDLSNAIINELKEGKQKALDHFFKLHYKPLCFFAERMLRDKAAAEDIAGDSFVKLWNKHTDFQTAQNVKAFLYITTRNACLNVLKQQQRDLLSKKELLYLTSEKEELAISEVVFAETLSQILQEIDGLPVRCQRIFKLSYFEGLKNQDIAEMLKISVHTVKNQKVRAIQLLRVKLTHKNLMSLFSLLLALIFNNNPG